MADECSSAFLFYVKLSEYLNFNLFVPLFDFSREYLNREVDNRMNTKNNRAVLDRRGEPFIMVTRAVIEDESLRSADKSVYATLCMYADNRTSECWPSRETLLKKAGVSDRTLRNSLRLLEDSGYIKVIKRYRDDGGQLSNLYVLLRVSE